MKIFSCFIITGIVASLSFVNPNTDASQKVLAVFSQNFNNAKDVKWFNVNEEYTAVFFQNEIRTSITYDKNGKFLYSRRYYNEGGLPFNVLLKLKEKYQGKTIKSVTEVVEDEGITYSILLEDEEKSYVVESTSSTNMKVQTKFKRQVR